MRGRGANVQMSKAGRRKQDEKMTTQQKTKNNKSRDKAEHEPTREGRRVDDGAKRADEEDERDRKEKLEGMTAEVKRTAREERERSTGGENERKRGSGGLVTVCPCQPETAVKRSG